MEENIKLLVMEMDASERIDRYIADRLEGVSRAHIQRLIKDGQIIVNNVPVKANYRVSENDNIEVNMPEPKELNIEPEDIPLDLLYEDEDIIIINKGKGMVVHPAAGHYSGTIVNALLYHCQGQLSGINGIMRPGIVHRIDMNTTGAIVVCKNDKSHNAIAAQLKEHTITRKYNAIVYHHFSEPEGTVDAPIGRHPADRKKMAVNYKNGKAAVTHYTVKEELKENLTLIECQLETGRTHQIRVHLASINHPLLGDEVYGPARNPFHLEGQALHARVLGFIHPSSGKYMEFEAPLPEYFQNLLTKLRYQE